jgi:hypothetical protein
MLTVEKMKRRDATNHGIVYTIQGRKNFQVKRRIYSLAVMWAAFGAM